MKNKKNICIFGHLDSEAGQFYNLLNGKEKRRVKFFVCFGKIPKVNISLEHKKRPNKKTSFYKSGKIFGVRVFDYSNYSSAIKKFKIGECYIVESNIKKRMQIYKMAKKISLKIKTFIHSSIIFGDRKKSDIGEGTILYPKNYIGYKTDVGKCCIIQSGCSIDHHNKIDDFCNLNPGIFTGGFTEINKCSEIHIRSTIINKIKIGKNCKIGAGSLVLKDVPPNSLAYGRPAKRIRKNNF